MQKLPKTPNVFGDISGRKFDHMEMNKSEEEEEKFQDTEACIPHRLKPSPGQYAKMIKSHLSKKNLKSALKVLDLVKENRDKPTMYLYNLLLHSFAEQGDVKQCFHLYNKAKKHGLQPNAATYTSLFNACAEGRNEVALEHLNKLRQSLYEKQFPLNDAHYNAMVKAYSWNNQIAEAFKLADEMRDNNIPIKEGTYNSLFHAAIADKEAGMRHALIIWHIMRLKKVNPSLTTYNLLLRTMRDTNFGNLKLDDILVSGWQKGKIVLKEGERPDLLASPPVLNTLLISSAEKEKEVAKDINSKKLIESTNLNDVFVNNRLILFGGLEGFLNRMAYYRIKPDIKTITLLLNLIPNSKKAEDLLIETADKRNVALDIDFFNMLIKRRSMRFDYKGAKEVINITEKRNLSPNVMTFGVLALGCQELWEAKEFLEGMEAFGYRPNSIIMSTLIRKACLNKNFEYLLFVMSYMLKNEMRPNSQATTDVNQFAKELTSIKKPTGKYRLRKLKRLKRNVEKFEQKYLKWQKMVEDMNKSSQN